MFDKKVDFEFLLMSVSQHIQHASFLYKKKLWIHTTLTKNLNGKKVWEEKRVKIVKMKLSSTNMSNWKKLIDFGSKSK